MCPYNCGKAVEQSDPIDHMHVWATFTEAVCGTSTSQLVSWNIGGVFTIISHGNGAGPLAGPSIGKPNQ